MVLIFILLQHDSVGPHGGFSFFVFKELVNNRHYSKLLRLGEEFQEELASFLKDRSDLLWLHEIYLNQFPSASETLHTYALRGSPDEDASVTTSRKPLSFAARRRLLYLSKIAATAGSLPSLMLYSALKQLFRNFSYSLHTFMALLKITVFCMIDNTEESIYTFLVIKVNSHASMPMQNC